MESSWVIGESNTLEYLLAKRLACIAEERVRVILEFTEFDSDEVRLRLHEF